MLKAASAMASRPTKIASFVTTAPSLGITPSSMSCLSNSGVATTNAASTTTVARKIMMFVRYGSANLKIRLTVPGFNFCSFTEGSAVIERWVIHAACIDIIKR